jgi:hypothetical protein
MEVPLMHRLLSILAGGLLIATTGVGLASAGDGRLSPELQDVRAAVARYHSVDQAAADGYFAASPCESSPAGTMGIHFINPALFGPGNDPLRPEILLYLPRADGSLELVGVEYFAVDSDQDLATSADRPSIFGQPFDGPMLGHGPGMPIHYDLHVWVAEANPAGVFAQWNPAIACP